jgi:hypothetical protein
MVLAKYEEYMLSLRADEPFDFRPSSERRPKAVWRAG